jgi:hypothetical protein
MKIYLLSLDGRGKGENSRLPLTPYQVRGRLSSLSPAFAGAATRRQAQGERKNVNWGNLCLLLFFAPFSNYVVEYPWRGKA